MSTTISTSAADIEVGDLAHLNSNSHSHSHSRSQLNVGAAPQKDLVSLHLGYRTLTQERSLSKRTAKHGASRPETHDEDDDIHKLTQHELELRFATTVDQGLLPDVVSRRLAKFGKNAISPPPTNYFAKAAEHLFGGFAGLMWVAGIIVLLAWKPLGEPNPAAANLVLAIAIFVVIFLQASFTAYQDWQSSKIMNSINQMLPQSATALRDGTVATVPVPDLVQGDVVHLKYGEKVPADLRLVSVNGLKIDNSILTGESLPINATVNATNNNATESHNVALMGTFITEGEGTGIVIATGDNTMMGRVAKLASSSALERTILQTEILRFVVIIASLCFLTAAGCFIWYIAFLQYHYPNFYTLSGFLSTDMGVFVAFVPEGLPIAVTVVLTLVARRMLSKRVLVKNLTVIETLGCCSVICSDKTGTLTTNQMVVNSIVVGVNDLFNVGADMTNKEHVSRIATAAHLCNGAEFDRDDVIASTPIATRRVRGNATDAAMLRFSHVYADAVGQASSVYCAMNVPFNSSTKRMLAGSSLAKNDQILLVKGAPDLLLPHCTAYASSNATDADLPLDTKALEQLKSLQESLSSKGERVLLLARRVLRSAKGQGATKRMSDDESAVQSLVAGGLTVLGLVGIVDPPRPEIKSVVGTMRGAGVRIFMVTGDFALTAGAIARQVGIFTTAATHTFADIERHRSRSTRPPLPKDATDADIAARIINDASLLLSGADLRNMTTAQWDLVCDYREIAFARTTPEQKLQIVHALQNRGNVVAVTGDGVNDAPALKNAHLGVAMGSGSEVAMAAGAMVLLDSN
ncbi:E1-E2 ATPase-domain-containing protein, partial [Blastocladiella britannica]